MRTIGLNFDQQNPTSTLSYRVIFVCGDVLQHLHKSDALRPFAREVFRSTSASISNDRHPRTKSEGLQVIAELAQKVDSNDFKGDILAAFDVSWSQVQSFQHNLRSLIDDCFGLWWAADC